MTEKSLKTRIVVTFATMLVMAMFLQSIVLLFLGVRAAIHEDVAWAQRSLQAAATLATRMQGRGKEKQELMTSYGRMHAESESFSCMYAELTGEPEVENSPCTFGDELLALSRQAMAKKIPVAGFAGKEWHVFMLRSEVALFAVPLIDRTGQVIGSITAERSLLPIYSRFEQETQIAFCYLLVNAIIFSSLGFFRMMHFFFRPLDRLVQLAENYRPDDQSLLLVSDDESAFRKLSTSLNTLLERIARDNRTLRQNVRELEGVNRELKEKNDLVVRSEKLASVGRLSAGLAHEIGNPLSIIQGYVELLGREDLTETEKKQFSEKAHQELDRIKRLIRQLLDFAGPIGSSEGTLSVNTLICDVISFVSMEKSFTDCPIRTQLLSEDDEVVADKDALRQVLINCLLNAVDATAQMGDKEREIVIATSNEPTSSMASLLVISIKDNGCGIDEDQLEYLFDPFFTTKEVGKGTGLGLFVCHTIMARLGGTITLHNRDPLGVEVRIEIPLQRPTVSGSH